MNSLEMHLLDSRKKWLGKVEELSEENERLRKEIIMRNYHDLNSED